MRPEPKRGQFKELLVRRGETEVVQGALEGGRIEPDAALTVQGALGGVVHVEGVLFAQGAVAGDIRVASGGVAVLQGLVPATIRNEGSVVIDAHPEGAPVDLVNIGEGRSGRIEDLSPELQRMLPTVTSSPPRPE